MEILGLVPILQNFVNFCLAIGIIFAVMGVVAACGLGLLLLCGLNGDRAGSWRYREINPF